MRVLSILASVLILTACVSKGRAPVTVYGTSKGAGSAGVHNVSSGETLWTISQRYNIVMRDIVLENHLSSPYILHPGQRLIMPPPREYQVRSGDSVSNIARLFDVSASEVVRINDVSPPYRLRTGQVLRLPSPSQMQPQPEVQRVAQRVSSEPVPAAVNSDEIVVENLADDVPSPVPRSQEKAVASAQEGMPVPSKKPTMKSNKPVVKKKVATPKRASSKFLNPVKGRVLSSYGSKSDGLYNDGINIAAPRGTPVLSADNGVVVYAGNGLKDSGNLVLVRHSDRWMTAYGHLDSMAVKNGAIVQRGQSIGKVGSTGAVREPQLHFEVRRGTQALNPAPYLEK